MKRAWEIHRENMFKYEMDNMNALRKLAIENNCGHLLGAVKPAFGKALAAAWAEFKAVAALEISVGDEIVWTHDITRKVHTSRVVALGRRVTIEREVGGYLHKCHVNAEHVKGRAA